MMGNKNKLNNKNKFSSKEILGSTGFSSLLSALMAIVLGLIFGFIVMLIAAPGNALAGFYYIILGGFNRDRKSVV